MVTCFYLIRIPKFSLLSRQVEGLTDRVNKGQGLRGPEGLGQGQGRPSTTSPTPDESRFPSSFWSYCREGEEVQNRRDEEG